MRAQLLPRADIRLQRQRSGRKYDVNWKMRLLKRQRSSSMSHIPRVSVLGGAAIFHFQVEQFYGLASMPWARWLLRPDGGVTE